MFVDEHVEAGGLPMDIVVRFALAEVDLIRRGQVLTGANLYGRGTRIRAMLSEESLKASDSNSGYLWLKLDAETLQLIQAGKIVTIRHPESARINRVVVLANAECKVYENS